MNKNAVEESRLSAVYTNRDDMFPWNNWKENIYHPRHPLGSLFQEHNHEIFLKSINQLDIDLSGKKILDVGCGFGYWLRYLVELGAEPEKCFGVDMSSLRIKIAMKKNSSINWIQQSISQLPFENNCFDIVIQTVVFSSILEKNLQIVASNEIRRVIKNDGIIVWLDLSTVQSDKLVSISDTDLHFLFPEWDFIYEEKAHPNYYRRLAKTLPSLAKLLYSMTRVNCESKLVILKQKNVK